MHQIDPVQKEQATAIFTQTEDFGGENIMGIYHQFSNFSLLNCTLVIKLITQ